MHITPGCLDILTGTTSLNGYCAVCCILISNVHIDRREVLLKMQVHIFESGLDLRFCILASSQCCGKQGERQHPSWNSVLCEDEAGRMGGGRTTDGGMGARDIIVNYLRSQEFFVTVCMLGTVDHQTMNSL